MDFKIEILDLLRQIKNVIKTKPLDKTLIGNCYFLNDDYILALARKDGDSRYPYSFDGLTMWVHSSGYISINESSFFFIPPALEGREPPIAFFGGIKKIDSYIPISLTGVLNDIDSKCPIYCVFGKKYCYYICEKENIIFALRLAIDNNKNIIFSTYAINNSNKIKDVYLSSFVNPIMEHNACDSEESKWFKKCTLNSDGATFLGVEDVSRDTHLTNYACLKRVINKKNVRISCSSSRKEFSDGLHLSIRHSKALLNGKLPLNKKITLFSETASYSDIISTSIEPNDYLQVDYKIKLAFNQKDIKIYENIPFLLNENDEAFLKLKTLSLNNKDFSIYFGKFKDCKLDNNLFNNFLKCVIKQVDYGANAKNSSLMLLGIRDVYQMVEASLMWDLKNARKIILNTMNFIDPSGRCPRQFSMPNGSDTVLMDNRQFIDQGQWIISTIHTYLSFSDDKSILDENCSYCELIGLKSGKLLNVKDSIYLHLEKIINYLISNIDKDTGCLKTLYGDWNDAIDGLGRSYSSQNEFSNGVSSMATFHLYKNLNEMADIAKYYNNDTNKINYYLNLAKKIEKSANKHCILTKDGEKRIVHGWGENKSFYVGSFLDVDNKSRHSLTSNAFYVISNLYKSNPNIKKDILDAYKCLDSKYGLKTFDVFFNRDAYKVGRIINLPKGTAENASTYVHSTIFAIRSLFMLGEGELAFKQIYKILPITHNFITTTPFVMANSYIYNPEIGVDGESMNDWYTGSSNTLIKTIVFDIFGLQVSLDSQIKITPSNYFPCDDASLKIRVRNKLLHINYLNKKQGHRTILINGKIMQNSFNLDDFSYDTIDINIID